MNKKENGLPRAIKVLAMTDKGMFSYPTKIRDEPVFFIVVPPYAPKQVFAAAP